VLGICNVCNAVYNAVRKYCKGTLLPACLPKTY
jgi:hypothetical protein